CAQLLVDPLPDLLERHWGSVVYELRELVDVDVGKEIRPRRQQLAELDVRRPELFESLAELLRRFAGRGPVADDTTWRRTRTSLLRRATRATSTARRRRCARSAT